jgi:hypothetical protein
MNIPEIDPLDLPVRGAAAIGKILNLTIPQVYHGLSKGLINADKYGALWESTPRRLLRRVQQRRDRAEQAA